MRKISFVCLQKEFKEDLEVQFIVNAMDANYELRTYSDIAEMEKNLASFAPDLVVVSFDALSSKEKWEYDGKEVAYHARTKEELKEGARYGLKTVGIAPTAKDLIKALRKNPFPPAADTDAGSSDKEQEPKKKPEEEHYTDLEPEVIPNRRAGDNKAKKNDREKNRRRREDLDDIDLGSGKKPGEEGGDKKERSGKTPQPDNRRRERDPEPDRRRREESRKKQEPEDDYDDDGNDGGIYIELEERKPSGKRKRDDDYYDDDDDRDDDRYDDDDDDGPGRRRGRESSSRRRDDRDENDGRRRRRDDEPGRGRRDRDEDYDNDEPRRGRRDRDEDYDEDDYDDRDRDRGRGRSRDQDRDRDRDRSRSREKSRDTDRRRDEREKEKKRGRRNRDAIDEDMKRDMGKSKDRPKVVSVYSAKGGVGKTKISTELALYLSMVSVGRDDLRVCLVDCNIDFGDVRATLHMGAKGPNMAYWADEIQEYLDKGETDIQYSKKDIEGWLRHDEDSGLYVLPAPLTNEDSMSVTSKAINIIFDNLINNGDFDYIVCDTGNNTRDSTMIALERSDYVFMLMVQDLNTANCNLAFIATMKTIDFDIDKIRLIINKIKPEKATAISVQDIIECFDEYECVGKIKYNQDVEISSNEGKPLAFRADHDFVKQLRSVVAYVLNDESFNEEPEKKKKGLFGFLKKKK